MKTSLLALVLICLVSSCAPQPTPKPTPTPYPTYTPNPTYTALPTPTPEWSRYEDNGAVVLIRSNSLAFELDKGGWLVILTVMNVDSNQVYKLYVNSLGTNYGSSVADFKKLRGPNPTQTVLSEGEVNIGERSFYRIVSVDNPPNPDKDTTNVYYFFYQGKQCFVVLFECFSCERVEDYYSNWGEILAKVEVN